MPAEWDNGNPALREVWSLTLKLRKAHLAERRASSASSSAAAPPPRAPLQWQQRCRGGGGRSGGGGARTPRAGLEVMRDGDDGGRWA